MPLTLSATAKLLKIIQLTTTSNAPTSSQKERVATQQGATESSSATTTHTQKNIARINQDKITDLLGIDRIEQGEASQDQADTLTQNIEALTTDITELENIKNAETDPKAQESVIHNISTKNIALRDETTRLQRLLKRLQPSEASCASTHIDDTQTREAKRTEALLEIEKQSPQLIEYLATYASTSGLGQALFADKFTPKSDDEIHANNRNILISFQSFCDDKEYFDKENTNAQNLYRDCYKLFMHRALFLENGEQNEVGERAYKAMVLFGPDTLTANHSENIQTLCSNLEEFIRNHASGFNRPIHDIFLYEIPAKNLDEDNDNDDEPGNNASYNLSAWKKAIYRYGMDLIKNFSEVPQIQKIVLDDRAMDPTRSNEHGIPLDKAYLQELIIRCIYKRGYEQPGLTKLYKHYKVSERTFDKTLELINTQQIIIEDKASGKIKAKAQDDIPNVVVRLNESNDLYMVKLPASDPRTLILGHITDCCQSINSNAQQCVLDGITLKSNGFYVFIKANKSKKFDPKNIKWDSLEEDKHTIIGQSYVWKGTHEELVLDSLEIKDSFKSQINPKEIADKIEYECKQNNVPLPTRITVGTGGRTNDVFVACKLPLIHALKAASMIEGVRYGDSRSQHEIYVSEALQQARESIQSIDGIDSRTIVSVAQALLINKMHANNYSINRIKALTSDAVLTAYATGYVQPDDLKDYDALKIQALTSHNAIRAYQSQWLTFHDLKNYDVPQIQALTSPNAIQAYTTGQVTFHDLKNYDVPQIEALTSHNAIRAYQSEWLTFHDLKNHDIQKIKALTSSNAIKAYTGGYVKPDDLKDYDALKIQALTSPNAIQAYTTGQVTFHDLKNYDIPQIEALTSYDAIQAYKDKLLKFDDLKDYDALKIEALTSYNAIKAYTTGQVTFHDLKDYDALKIQALTSHNAIKAYQTVKDYDALKIEALTSDNAIQAYTDKLLKFDDLKDYDALKIQALTSDNAIKAYNRKLLTFHDLKHYDVPKIEALTSPSAVHAYQYCWLTFHDFKDYDGDKLEALISPKAVHAYQHYLLTFHDLKHYDVPKIEALTSPSAVHAYQYCLRPFHDLKDLDATKIKALTSPNAIKAYETRCVKLDDLKDLDGDKLEALTSPNAIKAYETRCVKLDDLKDLDGDKLEALTSPNAIKAYTDKLLKFDDLKHYDVPKIEALTSFNAIKACESKWLTFRNLKNYDAPKIKALTSDNALNLYQNYNFDLNRYTVEQINLLSSDEIRAIYKKQGYLALNYLKDFKCSTEGETGSEWAAKIDDAIAREQSLDKIEQAFGITQADLQDINPTPTYDAVEYAYYCFFNQSESNSMEQSEEGAYNTKLKPYILEMIKKNTLADTQEILELRTNIKDCHLPLSEEFNVFYTQHGIEKSKALLKELIDCESNTPKISDYTAFALSKGVLNADFETQESLAGVCETVVE